MGIAEFFSDHFGTCNHFKNLGCLIATCGHISPVRGEPNAGYGTVVFEGMEKTDVELARDVLIVLNVEDAGRLVQVDL